MGNTSSLRVSVLGYGAIGSRVAHELSGERFPEIDLVGVVTRTAEPAIVDGFHVTDLSSAIRESDLIIEAASVAAVRDLGPVIIDGGCDLLLSSIGALADPGVRERLIAPGPGRCFASTGAIGGLDILAAASRDGGICSAALTSRKRAATLVQPWMDETTAAQVRTTTSPLTVFTGDVREAIARFPGSLNVGVALAAATGLWDETVIQLIADPVAELTTHEIQASGPSGHYEFRITNEPLSANPASSAIVPLALINGALRLARPTGTFL